MAVTTILATQNNRQGTFVSSSIVLPAEVSPGVSVIGQEVTIRALTNTTSYENVLNSFQFNLYRSADGGATWLHVAGIGWQGGRYVDKLGNVNPPPELSVGPVPAEWVGQRFRAELDIPRAMRLGAEIDVHEAL